VNAAQRLDSKEILQQAPGPPPGAHVNPEPVRAPVDPPERAPKVENCFSRSGEAHLGQLGVRLALTNVSNRCPQARQVYSKRGMPVAGMQKRGEGDGQAAARELHPAVDSQPPEEDPW
jgi:hypothetical protein